MLAYKNALEKLLKLARPLGPERVAIDEADGRVAFADVISDVDAPAENVSAMDGYAVASSDLARAPLSMPVVGEAKPGSPVPSFREGAACRIFTGATLPAGADAVVIQEDVTVAQSEAGAVARFEKPVAPWANVRRAGEDLAKGAIALPRGTRLSPAKVGLLASLDHAWTTVARRPVVTVLSTGDELRSPGTRARPGTIAESGSVTVRAMARRAGAVAAVHPLVRDDLSITKRAIDDSLRTSDLVVTIGGMSEGDFDLVRPALAELGVALEFWKVAIKPGKPLGVGTRHGAIVLGLPGNPAAAVVTFAMFGVPLLRALSGDRTPIPTPARATLTSACRHKPGRLEFVRATLAIVDGELRATPLAQQSSGSVASVGQADALVVIPSESGDVEQGATVDVYAFADLCA